MFQNEEEIQLAMQQMYRLLRARNISHELAKDLVQEAIIKAWLYEKEVPLEKQKAFLFKVVMNEFFMHYRKQKREVLIDEIPMIQSTDKLSEDWLLDKEQGTVIRKILSQLNPNYQRLLHMKYDAELSYKDIGEYLDIPPEHVKTYLQRARKAFKEKWGAYHEK